MFGLLAVLACLLASAEAQGDFPTMYTDWEAKVEAARMGRNMSFSRWEIYSPTHDRVSGGWQRPALRCGSATGRCRWR